MYRMLIEDLKAWSEQDVKKPLLVQGISQCGKTYLLKEFGAKFYKNVHYFDFEEDSQLSFFFENENIDPIKIINDLSQYKGRKIVSDNSLIILDSIQTCPKALELLPYFSYSASEFDIVAAGSFLDVGQFQIETLTLYPMNFYEFLHAQNSALATHIKNIGFKHNELLRLKPQLDAIFNDFLVIGGMPDVVNVWNRTRSFEGVLQAQERIVYGIKNMFSKISNTIQYPHLLHVWDSIANELCKENRKFTFSNSKKKLSIKELEDAVNRLARVGIIHKVRKIRKPQNPLQAQVDNTHYKIYMCDVGLFHYCAKQVNLLGLTNADMSKYLSGALIETVVCLELKRILDREIYFWAAEYPSNMEVEFIASFGNDVVPIVAKSVSVNKTSSLLHYSVLFSPKKAIVTSPFFEKSDILPVHMFWNLIEWLTYGD